MKMTLAWWAETRSSVCQNSSSALWLRTVSLRESSPCCRTSSVCARTRHATLHLVIPTHFFNTHFPALLDRTTSDFISGKRIVTVWRTYVRLSICPVSTLTLTHQGAACEAASVHFGPTIGRTEGPTNLFLSARRYASAVYAMALCLSLRLSQVGVLSKHAAKRIVTQITPRGGVTTLAL